jgi:hypothetical protein
MAKRAPKERPYHCQLCNRALAEDELGFVCQHVAHGFMVTLVADAPSAPSAPRKAEPLPDAACTACSFAMDAKKENAEKDANVHVVCERCYREARDRNIDDFTAADRKQGYVLVPRAHYDRFEKRKKPLSVGRMKVGRTVKLGFSAIPCKHPISLERMWVRVTCVLPGGEIHGALANDPALFAPKTLKADDTIVFSAKHVLEVEPEPANAKKKRPRRRSPMR